MTFPTWGSPLAMLQSGLERAVTTPVAVRPEMTGLHLLSDAVIAFACLIVPAALIWYVRRRKSPLTFGRASLLFGAFIALGGISHVVGILTVWQPEHSMLGIEKALVAAVTLISAIAIILMLPRLAVIRSLSELTAANQRLREEIMARELAEQDLRRAASDRDRAIKELEQFAYVTSQDLQVPLRTISSFSQLLVHRHAAKLDGDALEFLDYIDNGARSMQSLVEDLQQRSRSGIAEPAGFELRAFEETVTEAIVGLQDSINHSGARITYFDLPEMEANHRLLVELLQSLITNAIRFQRPDAPPRIGISVERDTQHWQVIVTDNGISIPADQIDSISANFRRQAGSPEDSTSLGLAICRKLAANYGGEMWATSDDSSSQFHLRLPVTIPVLRTAPPLKAARPTQVPFGSPRLA